MAYVTKGQVEDRVPPPVLNDALDDDGDGREDDGRFDSIVANASQEVDGYLSGLFSVPFEDPAPSKVRAAALIFVLEVIYERRNVPEGKNPYREQADFWRKHLQKVGNGELPFDAGIEKEFTPGAAITGDMKTDVQGT